MTFLASFNDGLKIAFLTSQDMSECHFLSSFLQFFVRQEANKKSFEVSFLKYENFSYFV